ncbi:aspartate--tRNA ligase [Gammaproteobacteria bacterium]|nr:aspartate--tRNA ligase [Gammaproteobacteria bacterium]
MKYRSHYCGQVDKKDLNQSVKLCGWIMRSRDHGGVVFIDLFDHTGLVQIVANPTLQDFSTIESLSTHSVMCIEGEVIPRPDGTVNPNLPTGAVEIKIEKLLWHNKAAPLGFDVNDTKVSENVRAANRILDIRSERMQNSLRFRAKMMRAMRQYLDQTGFLEVETPILTRSTPEGARDYLVPSRTHPSKAFALPQSPQQFKQMLMMGCIDRYYQFARCFRDEDLRADRQPEFTQLDLEMSFLSADEICEYVEGLVHHMLFETLGLKLPKFKTLSYDDALKYYGTDAPHLGNPLKFIPLDEVFQSCEFKVFQTPAKAENSRVVGIKLSGGCEQLSRKDLDGYTNQVMKLGAKGLAYLKVNAVDQGLDGLSSPILKFLDEATVTRLLAVLDVKAGDLVFFGAGENKLVNLTMHALAKQIAQDLNLIEDGMHFVWVKDFPMFEEVEDGLTAVHHPFTAPVDEDLDQLANAKAQAYDLVLNGYELGGGSIRISDPALQQKIFNLLGLDDEMVDAQFGYFMKALTQGTPIHGGLAFGMDRMAMVLQGIDSIREVIAFPKTQTASCALTQAPSHVSRMQWFDLGLQAMENEDGGS